MKKISLLLSILLSVIVALGIILGISACTSTSSQMNMPAANAFTITAKPFAHWHTLAYQKVEFTVKDTATGQGKAGLPVEVQIARAVSSQIITRSVADKGVKDEGNGLYTINTSALEFYSYAFSLRFIYNGQQFVSQPFVTEITKAGEEGIKVEARGTSYVYQIRNFWRPGDVRGSDNSSVLLSFEIMRGVPEGASINWTAPWTNFAEHVINAASPKIVVESVDGKVKDELTAVNKGKGIYEATRKFSVAEVGQGQDYDVRFIFTDPYNGAIVTSSQPYPLHARAAN